MNETRQPTRRQFIASASTVAGLAALPSVATCNAGTIGSHVRPRDLPILTTEPIRVIFGRRLAVAMERARIGAQELADAAGLTPHGLDLVLKGQMTADVGTADRLSDAVGISLCSLIDRRKEPFSPEK